MGDDNIVRRLIEILSAFYIEKRPVEEDLTCSLTNEFLQNIQIVLLTKQSVILHRWKNFIHVCGYEMLSSLETYLRYVLYACRLEFKLNFNIFEKFLGVFALVVYLNEETLKKTEVNFCKLIPDIFMVFYSSELKKIFCKRGGFHQFAKYINNPNYIALKSSSKVLSFLSDLAATVDVLPNDSAQQMEIVSDEESDLLKNITLAVEKDWSSLTLAQNILNSTKVGLPLLPRKADLTTKVHDFTHEEISQLEDTERALEALEKVLEGCSNSDSETSDGTGQLEDPKRALEALDMVLEGCSNSDTETSDGTGQLEDTKTTLEVLDLKIKVHDFAHEEISQLEDPKRALEALDKVLEGCSNSDSETSDGTGQMSDKSLYDDIIEAVIRYNHSRSSDQEKANNQLEKEAYGILEHLKGNIESFIEVLDDYD